jgi:hypothetical protein
VDDKAQIAKQRRSRRNDYLLAAFLTACFYGAMGAIFNLDDNPRSSFITLPTPASVVGLQDPPPRHAPGRKWQGELLAWADLRDPTLMSLPHPNRGFSTVRVDDFDRELATLDSPSFEFTASVEPPFQPVILTERILDLQVAVLNARRVAPPAAADAKPSVALPAGVYWTDANGERLENIPTLELDPSSDSRWKVERETVLMVRSDGMRVRTKVVRSCGESTLDGKAIEHLRTHFLPQTFGAPIGSKDRELRKGVWHFFVHWRYAANVRDQRLFSDPVWHNRREVWHDLDWY